MEGVCEDLDDDGGELEELLGDVLDDKRAAGSDEEEDEDGEQQDSQEDEEGDEESGEDDWIKDLPCEPMPLSLSHTHTVVIYKHTFYASL